MVLLNVLDESWVVKLCGVIAAGRQITARQNIFMESYFKAVKNLV